MIHRRQFIITKKYIFLPDFKSFSLDNNYKLFYHKDLNIECIEDCVVLGYAFSSIDREISIQGNIEESIRSWAGRWVLITPTELYLDAAGSLGVFYSYEEGALILSSSLALLHALVSDSKWISNYELKRLEFRYFDFYPAPYTPWSKCMSLLPSQKVDLVHMKIVNRSDFNFCRYTYMSNDERISNIIKRQGIILKNIQNRFSKLYLPLTSGVDSRTILAIALYHNIDVNLYSIQRLDTDIWDNDVPLLVAKRLGLPFYLYKEHKICNTNYVVQMIYDHCGGRTTAGTELSQFLNGIDVGDANTCVLWGPLWEISIRYYSQYFSEHADLEDENTILSMLNLASSNNMFQKSLIHKMSFEEWIRLVFKNPILGMTWMDRLYWEQRVGAWAKYSLQMIDLFDSVRIIPVNCQDLLELLMGFDVCYNTPNGKEAQKDLIKKCVPELAKIRYGGENNFFYWSENIIKKFLRNI